MEGSVFIEEQDEQAIDLNKILTKYRRRWYWFVVGLIITFACAFIYLRYSTPVYQTSAALLIKNDKESSPSSAMQDDVLAQLTFLTGNSNVLNEMAILKSRTIVGRAIRDLGLQSTYWITGRYKDKEIYNHTPVMITPILLRDSVHGTTLQIKVLSDKTFLVTDEANHEVKVTDGSTVSINDGTFLIEKNPSVVSLDSVSTVTVKIASLNKVVTDFQNNLNLSQTDKQSSVIELSFKTTVPQKGEDFLNTLIREYSLAGLADKNQTAANTIQFVDSRLDSITGELSDVEGKIQDFLRAHSIANIDEQSKAFIDQAGQLDQQIIQQNMQLSALRQIQEYVNKPNNRDGYVPSTLGIQDPTLIELVQNYNALQLRKTQQIEAGAGPKNPIIIVMDTQLNQLRADIKENIVNLLKGSESVAQKLQERNEEFESKINGVPEIQRDLIALKRQQEIKSTLYVYMLQKREEASITEAASVFNNRIIDPAMTNLMPVMPKKRLIYLAALLLGLVMPGGFIYLKELLDRKIGSRQDVEAHTTAPIFAEIGHSKQEGSIVVVSGARSVVAEQFRNLRTNLSFVLGSSNQKVILITSSMGGEGKSFVSLNLAMTYALMGKRIALLGLDLRKPKLGSYLGLEHVPGISNFLSGQLELDELPIEVNYDQYSLYFINSGPIPPNPAELLLQPAMKKMFTYLNEHFDYIILDTPPVGLVTDAQLLGEYANASLYIVRHRYTMKEQVKLLESYYNNKRLPNMGVVLNDIKAGDAYRYSYGGYGYGNGYYSENGSHNGTLKNTSKESSMNKKKQRL
jgi:capsular exopolysaccharide synthesis family protein